MTNRRTFVKTAGLAMAGLAIGMKSYSSSFLSTVDFSSMRPALKDRKFVSKSVEQTIITVKKAIADPDGERSRVLRFVENEPAERRLHERHRLRDQKRRPRAWDGGRIDRPERCATRPEGQFLRSGNNAGQCRCVAEQSSGSSLTKLRPIPKCRRPATKPDFLPRIYNPLLSNHGKQSGL